jgi:hypothetical protein
MLSSYPHIFSVGHAALGDFLKNPVQVEEKIDGSQFSFQKQNRELLIRSKGKEMFADAPEKMFIKGVEAVAQLDLHDGWIYRAEYLSKPKHNSLAYSRVPKNHVMLFDVNIGVEKYLSYEEKAAEAERLGLEVVPLLYTGVVTLDIINGLLETESILGGQKIEGVVLKNYSIFGSDGKVVMGKYVSEAFKEKHAHEWKQNNPDVIQTLIDSLKTEARWAKSVQHLRDEGLLENDPRDIGKLIKAVAQDIHQEEADEIKERLFNHFWPQIQRGVTSGVAEWYKKGLMETQIK